jgi:predicted nucleic acid-binding protein
MGFLNIINNSKIYADTSVFIYTVESHPEYWSLLEPLWDKFQRGAIEICTSELTLLEVLINPIKQGDNLLISDYEQLLLDTNIQLKPINQSILREAANLRANTKIKTPDAIHIATALAVNCTAFLTNDLGLKNIPNLTTIVLKEVKES